MHGQVAGSTPTRATDSTGGLFDATRGQWPLKLADQKILKSTNQKILKLTNQKMLNPPIENSTIDQSQNSKIDQTNRIN